MSEQERLSPDLIDPPEPLNSHFSFRGLGVNEADIRTFASSTFVGVTEEPNARVMASRGSDSLSEARVAVITPEPESPFTPSQNVDLPMVYQEYLYKLSNERGLDFLFVLAVVKQESQFDPRLKFRENRGYMQINKVNYSWLSKKLGTPNSPYDPYVNLNWGTYMLADLFEKYQDKGLEGESLKNAVLSAYNQGEAGYAKKGIAKEYISRHETAIDEIKAMYKAD